MLNVVVRKVTARLLKVNVILPPEQHHYISAIFLYNNSPDVMPSFRAVLSITGKYDTFG
jgi:hypothetical protein